MATLIISKMDKKPPKNYVNNSEFLEKIKEFKKIYRKDESTRIPEDIAEIILNIATNLAKSPKFSGYTYKDEMISDAVLNCLEKIHNFSPRKSSNPFAYFTQIIYYAFLRRIKGENKHSYIKDKSLQKFQHRMRLEYKHIKIKDYHDTEKSWETFEETPTSRKKVSVSRKRKKSS